MPESNQMKKCEVFYTKVECQFCSISSCNVRLICNGRNGLTASNNATPLSDVPEILQLGTDKIPKRKRSDWIVDFHRE